jgi:hypothetical protein
MKLQMKREALEKLNRRANEMPAEKAGAAFWHGRRAMSTKLARFWPKITVLRWKEVRKYFRINSDDHVGA